MDHIVNASMAFLAKIQNFACIKGVEAQTVLVKEVSRFCLYCEAGRGRGVALMIHPSRLYVPACLFRRG